MEITVFLLTTNKETERRVLDSIPLRWDLISVTAMELMVRLYEKSPEILLVDLDNLSEQTLDMIYSTISLMYIPVIYLYREKPNIPFERLKDEVILSTDRMETELNNLLRQAVRFKRKYDEITESYDAIDMLSGSIKSLLDKSMSKELVGSNLIAELFNLVLSKNQFISNKPESFWIILPREHNYQGSLFISAKNGEFSLKSMVEMETNLSFSFDVSSENGFFRNFNMEEISDIDSSTSVFPDVMQKTTGKIRNFVGYSVDDIVLLAMNYSQQVSSYEISIIKTIAIYFDLINTIQANVKEIENSFEYTTNALARAAEVNDDSTGSHIKRVNTFSKMLAEEMGLERNFIKAIFNAAQMHDVGKIYVDKHILTKPGKLTEEEFENMKKHTVYGELIIGDSNNLRMSAEIARNHHEKFDGTGYPSGKRGKEIPLAARIVALADVYDALRSKRPYKAGFTHEEAYNIITTGDGRVMPEHFDPKVLTAFKNIHKKLSEVYDSLGE